MNWVLIYWIIIGGQVPISNHLEFRRESLCKAAIEELKRALPGSASNAICVNIDRI
jgi:hypothetical protein